MLTRANKQAGVTIIELMIGLVVLGVLIGIGVPSFRTWIANSQVRTAADGILNGLQLARSEAIRRNKPVEFQFTSGTNWVVQLATTQATLSERGGDEGSGATSVTATPGGTDTVTFGALGAPVTNWDNSLRIDSIDIAPLNPPPGARALRINVSAAGTVRMCDPDTNSPPLPAGDPRRCGP
jgi:type IV fimbrial biogenesis protein FimT